MFYKMCDRELQICIDSFFAASRSLTFASEFIHSDVYCLCDKSPIISQYVTVHAHVFVTLLSFIRRLMERLLA